MAKNCSVAPGVAVPLWATETMLSLWLAADEARVSHVLTHVVWWKKKYIYMCVCVYIYMCVCVYIYIYIYVCVVCVCVYIYIYTHPIT